MLRCDRRKLSGLAGALATMLIVVAQVRSQPPETARTRDANRSNTLLAQARLLNYVEAEGESSVELALGGLAEPNDLIGTELLLNDAVMSYHDGRYEEAWRQLQSLDRADPTVAYYRGLTLQALGRTEAAGGSSNPQGYRHRPLTTGKRRWLRQSFSRKAPSHGRGT